MTDMGVGIAHMNKEEKLQKTIKKMQGFSTYEVRAVFQNSSNPKNPTTIINCEIDAENEREVVNTFKIEHPTFVHGQITMVNLDKNKGITRFDL